jgi:chaperonin GroEL
VSQTFGVEVEFVERMRFDKGYISPYFVTDPERMEVSYDDPYVGSIPTEPTMNDSALRFEATDSSQL